MQIKVFTIPVFSNEQDTEELNTFLRSHRVLSIEKEFVNNTIHSFWTVWIRYDNFFETNTEPSILKNKNKKSKIDYKEILDSDTFQIFSKLREIRKKLAIDDGVAVYIVFTNDELAKIAGLEEISAENIKKIKGIGEKRISNYANQLVLMFKELQNEMTK